MTEDFCSAVIRFPRHIGLLCTFRNQYCVAEYRFRDYVRDNPPGLFSNAEYRNVDEGKVPSVDSYQMLGVSWRSRCLSSGRRSANISARTKK